MFPVRIRYKYLSKTSPATNFTICSTRDASTYQRYHPAATGDSATSTFQKNQAVPNFMPQIRFILS